MKLLLVGGTGVLSGAIARYALERGDSVVAINRGNRKGIPGTDNIVADRHDYGQIEKKLGTRSFDIVIDFLVFNKEDAIQSFSFFRSRCTQYILISSCFVYDFTKQFRVDENSPRGLACWGYSKGKCEAEDALIHLAADSSCNYTIVRPFVTYGDTRIPYSLSPAHGFDWTIIARAMANKPTIMWNNGLDQCNIMHVDDFCAGFFGLLLNKKAYGESVNVCSDTSTCWIDVIKTLEKVTGITIPLVDVPPEIIKRFYKQRSEEIDGRSFKVIASNQKLKELVPDFHETVSLFDGIRKTVESYKSNNYHNGIDWVFDAKSDEIVNAWWHQKQQGKRLSFVNYFHSGLLSTCYQYYSSFSNPSLFIKIIRKIVNTSKKVISNKR